MAEVEREDIGRRRRAWWSHLLSRSSCAPRLRGAPDAGEEGDESRGYHKGCPTIGVRCAALYEREGLIRRPVTVCELHGLPLTVVGCGRHPLAGGYRRGARGHPQGALQTLASLPSRPAPRGAHTFAYLVNAGKRHREGTLPQRMSVWRSLV